MKKLVTIFSITMLLASAVPLPVSAAPCTSLPTITMADVLKRSLCSAGLIAPTDEIQTGEEQVVVIVAAVINLLLSFTGLLFVILMIYGGYLWMTARGNEEQVTNAEQLVRNSVIGIIIVFSAFAVSRFAVDSITTFLLAS